MQWWEDQLLAHGITGSQRAGMIAGFADAFASLNDLWFWDTGNTLRTTANNWFVTNMASSTQESIASQILAGSDKFEGLDWLLAAFLGVNQENVVPDLFIRGY